MDSMEIQNQLHLTRHLSNHLIFLRNPRESLRIMTKTTAQSTLLTKTTASYQIIEICKYLRKKFKSNPICNKLSRKWLIHQTHSL
jgi:hypothetical protein